uniref:uncharacterized protein LOC122591834 n=1 Tax=Erigeron canadensis TaxID=72917 RepID=UPI001CB89209|nr:uncharacterized protein LOC122591834 [Erigeron canadensis]
MKSSKQPKGCYLKLIANNSGYLFADGSHAICTLHEKVRKVDGTETMICGMKLKPNDTSWPFIFGSSCVGIQHDGDDLLCGMKDLESYGVCLHSCNTRMPDGKVQSFCGLKLLSDFNLLIAMKQTNAAVTDTALKTTPEENQGKLFRMEVTADKVTYPFIHECNEVIIFSQKISIHTGKEITLCGLKLIPITSPYPCKEESHLVAVQAQKFKRQNGEDQMFCGLIVTPDKQASLFAIGCFHTGMAGWKRKTVQKRPTDSTISQGTTVQELPQRDREKSAADYETTPGSITATGQTTYTVTRPASNTSGVDPPALNFGPPSYNCPTCNAVMWYEERSKSTPVSEPISFSSCCQNGKILLEPLRNTPEPLKRLLDYDQAGTSTFRDNIRTYNSMFCFTSFGAQIDNSINQGRGVYTFRISGQNYHRIGSLLPSDGAEPRYAQLYFFDTQNEIKHRISAIVGKGKTNSKIDEAIVGSLMDMLNEHNCVAKAFRMARDWCLANEDHPCELRLLAQRSTLRQYSTPNVSEIAALVTNDFGVSSEPRDIVVSTTNGFLQRISELHPLYMALQYPLLFPYGESGYHEAIPYFSNTGRRKTKRTCLTMREFYCYRIHYRPNEGTTLLRGGRLYQQYLVDSYTAAEEQRLRYVRTHQTELRVELYDSVCDAVTRGDTNEKALGQRIVLPASFTGSPRYMVQNYQDAMALCRKFGNPDLFITFTANPKWPEVGHMLSFIPGQKSHDRAEDMARVFKMKLDDMMYDIMKNNVFGQALAGVHTIEFQKRGLPHAHILIWLDEKAKCKTPADIDDIISAEIPLESIDPRGYKAVTDYMLHGPCGPDAKDASCMNMGKCMKHFPKPFYQETTIDEDGYAVYRRRKTNNIVVKYKIPLDNRFVVPYNRYLLLKYDAHINVEWCNRSKAIKYLFKYLNKGPDRATIVFHDNLKEDGKTQSTIITKVDEVKNYLDCRYLSPCEAVWHLFALDIHYCKPSVVKLTYHLPEKHTLTLHDSESLPALLRRPGIKDTMFTKWFELNRREKHARQYKYSEIPSEYVWVSKDKYWEKRRRRKNTVGRIVYCHSAAGPRYYLRMLLNVVKGPQSYKNLKTVNGRVCESFKEACYAYGLLNDDREWSEAIT